MTKLTYEQLRFPNYRNTNTAVRLRVNVDGKIETISLSLSDLVYAAEIAGLNMLTVADTGRGKTQLMTDIAWHHFGGDQESGNANWADGRPSFDITDLFERQEVDLSSGRFDSNTIRQLRRDKTGRCFFGVDELNRAPNPKQNEFFDLADGKYTFDGQRYKLGRDDYALFMSTANLNKVNGDFSGTFGLDRALLNRAHLTLDLDHKDFRPTAEDELAIEERKANPRVDVPPPQDISDGIIEINHQIREDSRKLDPYLTAFRFLIGRGLDYCDQDKYKDKGAFPTLCGDCSFRGKDLCSLVKGSSERKIAAIKALAYGLSHIAKLKLGKEVEIDPFDAALQAFRFTTYHGNLNDVIASDEYGERRQTMMDEAVQELSGRVRILEPYIPQMLEGYQPVSLVYNSNGKERRATRTDELVAKLDKNKISYQTTNLKTELKEKGIGTDWINAYVKKFGRK